MYYFKTLLECKKIRILKQLIFVILILLLAFPVSFASDLYPTIKDSPRGVRITWWTAPWNFANDKTFPNDLTIPSHLRNELWLTREYNRLNRIGANYQLGLNADVFQLMNEYDVSDSSSNTISLIGENTHHSNFETNGGTIKISNRIKSIFKKDYNGNSGYSSGNNWDQDSLDNSLSSIEEIVNDNLNAAQFSESLSGWLILHEMLNQKLHDNSSDDVFIKEKVMEHANYAVQKIRERDFLRPIIYNGGYSNLIGSDLTRKAFYESILKGEETFVGWNVFQDHKYPFNIEYSEGSHSVLYNGYAYNSNLLHRLNDPQRQLSILVENYAENTRGSLIGPEPEWWHAIQGQRQWRSDGDGTCPSWYLQKRRPTQYEYRMQAYAAFAAGAKGYDVYTYASKDPSEYNPKASSDIDPTLESSEDPNDYSMISGVDQSYALDYLEDGMIYRKFTRIDTLNDRYANDLVNLRNSFRAPYSAAADGRDDDIFSGYEEHSWNESKHSFDYVSALNKELVDLLPILRDLRWWWLVDGTDDTYTLGGANYQLVVEPTVEQMDVHRVNALDGTFGGNLKDRFSLRHIFNEDTDIAENDDNRYVSSVICGLFDEGSESSPEYYFFVNKQCSIDSTGVQFNSEPNTFEVWFEVDSPNDVITFEEVWSNDNDYLNTTALLSTVRDEIIVENNITTYYKVKSIRLDGGDGILIKVHEDLHTYVGGTILSNTTITGQRKYTSNLAVTNSSTLTLDGSFEFLGNLTISDYSYLNIEEGSILRFAAGKGIIVNNGSRIVADGSETEPIQFLPNCTTDLRDYWTGITLGENLSSSTTRISHATIKNAEYGLKHLNPNSYLSNNFTYLNISECETGIHIEDNYITNVDYSKIYNCDKGIFITHPNRTTSGYVRIRKCEVSGCENNGIELNTAYSVQVASSTIQNNGEYGIKSRNVAHLYLNAHDDTPSFPGINHIRNNGLNNHYQYGLYLYDTDVERFNNSAITENKCKGVKIQSGTVLSSTALNDNIVANNALGYSSSSVSNTQFYIYDISEIDISFKNWGIWTDDDVFGGNYYFYVYHSSTNDSLKLIMPGNFWKDTDMSTFGTSKVRVIGSGASLVRWDVTYPLAWMDQHMEDAYWLASASSPKTVFENAYSLLSDSSSTTEEYIEALAIFENLAEENYVPSLGGMKLALQLLNYSSEEIEYYLNGLYSQEQSDLFESNSKFLTGAAYRESGEYAEAIEKFLDIASNTNVLSDSINALIEIEETIRLQAIVESDSSSTISSLGRKAVISKCEQRINQLHEEMEELCSGQKNSTSAIPTEYSLDQAYPNPFNPSVKIPFALPEVAKVNISIYNVLGQKVATLVNSNMKAGHHNVIWESRSDTGLMVSSGVYFVTMKSEGFTQTQKILLLK